MEQAIRDTSETDVDTIAVLDRFAGYIGHPLQHLCENLADYVYLDMVAEVDNHIGGGASAGGGGSASNGHQRGSAEAVMASRTNFNMAYAEARRAIYYTHTEGLKPAKLVRFSVPYESKCHV